MQNVGNDKILAAYLCPTAEQRNANEFISELFPKVGKLPKLNLLFQKRGDGLEVVGVYVGITVSVFFYLLELMFH